MPPFLALPLVGASRCRGPQDEDENAAGRHHSRSASAVRKAKRMSVAIKKSSSFVAASASESLRTKSVEEKLSEVRPPHPLSRYHPQRQHTNGTGRRPKTKAGALGKGKGQRKMPKTSAHGATATAALP